MNRLSNFSLLLNLPKSVLATYKSQGKIISSFATNNFTWYRLKGNLDALDKPRYVMALFEYDNHIAMWISWVAANGKFSDIIKLESGFKSLKLIPSSHHYDADLLKIQATLNPVSWADRHYSMLKRSASYLRVMPKTFKKKFNVNVSSPWIKLQHTYNVASLYRLETVGFDYALWRLLYGQIIQHKVLEKNSSIQDSQYINYVVIDTRQFSSLDLLLSTIDSIKQSSLCPSKIWILTEHPECFNKIDFISFKDLICPLSLHNVSTLIRKLDSLNFVLWIDLGACLFNSSLHFFNESARNYPDAQAIYSDHELTDQHGFPSNPQCKPDWSDELAVCSGYPGGVLAVKPAVILDCLGVFDDLSAYKLILCLSMFTASNNIVHIPSILWQQLSDRGCSSEPLLDDLQVYLDHRHAGATAVKVNNHLKINYPLPDHLPKVTIIIPTRDALHVLKPCLESLLRLTNYANYEVFIVDNQSVDPGCIEFMQDLAQSDSRVSILPYDQAFNYSAINNYAASCSDADFLCLLNNDTEIFEPTWLQELVSVAINLNAGAVGCKLLYGDGRLQHAGDLVGGAGCAHHLYGDVLGSDPGYMNRIQLRQDLSAVTAACLLTPKSLFDKLGGLDATHLAVAFNDVDYCLRVIESGSRVIYTPFATLYHHESVSRGADLTKEQIARNTQEVDYMLKRWSDKMFNDPYYNPNLCYQKCDFSLRQNVVFSNLS